MPIYQILCLADDNTLGDNGGLPWHLPTDLARFKQLTLHSTLIMGRKTQQSLPRPLPGRQNIVLTRNPGYRAAGYTIAHSLPEALQQSQHKTIFIIGGVELFKATETLAEKVYLTRIHAKPNGDTKYFFDGSNWRLHHKATYDGYDFCEYVKPINGRI